ncbi:hypothetical protein FSP39_009339 [Pinctada imbricata]|uniref:Nesprin-1 spectrin repeats region domain-containing protein n=1 Tax=Pinctada imbricata TaxID=66713 RepID=A0AA88XXA4_PINIB|nr:hypothetical protein FSP39_009339 [Pinctada imbricata]
MQIKDQDLKSTLPEKHAQVDKFKALQEDVHSRQHQFDDLHSMASQVQGADSRLVNFSTQLNTRYQTVKNSLRDLIHKLQDHAREHEAYNENFSECAEWVNTLARRLQVCADMDTYQDCQDWLNSFKEKVHACSDTSGDRLSLQNKLERLKEYAERVGDGEKKLKNTKSLAEKTAKNSSQPGREVLKREMEHLSAEWEDYLNRIQQAEEDLGNALIQWGDFESKFGTCSAWLKEMEQKVKNYELKNTLKEKLNQVEKFKRQREEILSHQPEIDRFTDDAQNLMHTSSDSRLSTQVSQLTNRYRGLLSLVKDLIGKWEKYAQDHQAYENRIGEFNTWLGQADDKLDNCQQPAADQETMEERRTMIQMLLAEKEHGLQKLNAAVESGEKLYPDTAATGREKVRQELRRAKEDWDRLCSSLNDAQRRVDSFLMQWSSYSDGQDQLLKWMADMENALKSDVDLKNTLQEKRMQLQNFRSMQQDISSHQRLVDSVVEKAQGVLQSTNNPEVAGFIKDVSSRYEQIGQAVKTQIRQCDQNVNDHQQYHDASQAAIDWLTLMKDRVSMCADTSGDRHTLQNKLDRVQELLALLPDGSSKMKHSENCGAKAKETTALQGRQAIQQEMDMLKMDWETYSSSVKTLRDNLERAIRQWAKYEEQYDKISHWIRDMEKKVKDFPLRSALEEKMQQYQRYQELMQDIKGHQREVDQFSDEGQTLQQITGEARVATAISQLLSRYQSLQHSVKDILKRCEQNVSDHRHYKEKQADCAQWLVHAKEKFGASADTTGSRNELEDRLEKIQELVADRDAGFNKLNAAIEAGEKLYPNTAAEGREVIRQELRQLKLGWESLFDDLSAAQRKLEVALVHWTSFDDSYGQVEHWLREMESQLDGQLPLRSTLEEKKTQLQNYKVLHQDVLSYQRVIDSVNDKAQTLVHSSSDPQLSKFVTQARSRYQKLCAAAKEHVHDYEQFVADHQQYNDAYNNCIEWLNNIREKLSMCADVSGDRHTIQSRLDKIQSYYTGLLKSVRFPSDIVATKMEGEPKVRNVVELSERVLPNTAPQGKDIVMRETDALKHDWEAFVNALQKTKSDLENCMDQWKEFDTWQDKVSAWLKELEVKVRETELKATLKEKQSQLDKLKHLHRDLIDHQADIDALSDAAQDLVRVSTDTRVISQASQLGTKYQGIYTNVKVSTKYQGIYTNVKELCRRWEQYVLDHQAYAASFDQCKSWLSDMRKKLQLLTDTSGDRRIIQERLAQIQDLMADKEEGLHMLQIALDNLQIVLPNTSVPGRDNMRREMQGLQSEYDTLSADLNDLKTKLDGTLAQWTVYDDSTEQLSRWLKDLEEQLDAESQLQNTLQEKKLQFERVKVQQLNIASQQSTIDNLNDKAENLKATSKDLNLGNQIKQLVLRYEQLLDKVKDLLNRCEKNVKDHQVYRDTFMDASDWLSSMVDKLNACSDVRGDRTAIEAQLQKLQDIYAHTDAGKEKLEITLSKGDIVLPETATQGQELIKEELNMLSSEYEGFTTDCDDLQDNLEKLLDEWRLYEQQYDELSQWIKDTETDMKDESDLKATLEEKTVQLEKQNAIHEEILNKQISFDGLAERAQTLLQSTTDNRLTSQLTQMSSRYTSLIASSKDLLKRYEQYTMDHEQYAEAFTEAATWLQSTRDKLSVCADTSGDRYKIQTQLEKLQEFVVVKEEGQLLIHTANTWGEKTMTNTSIEGREMIRKELQQLQQEWDSMISEVTDTKVMLESCLLQWTDYSDSYDKIQKWLRDMEKRLRETEPKADLSEKRADLQRLKGVYQDVISYEQMIESVGTKAQDLSTRSPVSQATTDTSQLVSKYQTIKDQAMEMLARSEQCVAQHQAYHDTCNSFSQWLRTSREKLSTCSDTYGEKSAIVSKIERAKALTANLGEGVEKLTDATKAGEATLPTTSPTGQTKIRTELGAMKRDFEEYRTMVTEAQDDLERCLSRLNDFEESYNQFNAWLKDTENFLRADLELKSSLEEKKKHWEQYQNYLDEVLAHQSSLDRVNERAQALLQTNADAKTSHAITQLTTRYQGVITMAKDIVKNLEIYFSHHMNYNQNYTEFQDWLTETKQRLRNIHDSSGTKDDVGGKLAKLTELQAAMDLGHNFLRSLLESSERTLPNTSPRGCQTIRQETEHAKQEYENLLTDVSQGKRSLEMALSQWGDFDRNYDQFCSWLSDVENKLRQDPDARADLPEKRSSLEKYKALQADIASHKEVLDKLEEKADHLKDGRPRSLVADLRSRYSKLNTAAKDMMGKLEDQVQGHEEYRRAYIACLDWLANNRHRLQRLSDYSGDRKILQDRLQQLKDFKGEMRQGQDMVNNATQLGERVCSTTAPRGQEAIHKEIQNLKDDWNTFASSVNEMEANLEACIGNWEDLDEEYQRFLQWVEKMEGRVKGLMENKPDQQRKQQQFMEGEDVFDEILKKKLSLEHVKERSDAVGQRSSDPRLSNNMMQLSTKYHSLVSQAKNMVQKLSENARDHKAYNDAFDAAARWLADMDERVQECNDTSGDWHTIQERMEDIKDITNSMDEGLQKVNLVCDLAEKILPNTSSEGKRLIEQQVTELTNEWEKLNLAISECSTMLEGVQDRWNDYEEYYGSLVKWLADMESTLMAEPEPKAQLVEKKTQLDKYKLMLSDVENHHRLVNELAERVANLEALSENPDVADSLADVQNRYDRVRNRAREVVARLERVYHDHLDFHEAQQDSEKWLLQTSFKLMSHNSLNVSSMELTQRQIDKHRALIKEIEDYRRTLDSVNHRGRLLVDENSRVPKLANQVQAQLQNLEESYLNLQSTAEQIRVRLDEAMQRWQQYKDLLERDRHFLRTEFPSWMSDVDKNVPDHLQDAQHKLETVRTERRMNDIRDIIHQWENVDRTRNDIRDWLHSKQEELQDLEQKPAKLHAEAAELDIANLQALREEVQAKGPAIDSFVNRYRDLTKHKPSLVDPVVRAVRDDWEELLGQIENLLEDREQALQASRELQDAQNTMDNDLDDFVKELEKIEAAEATLTDKAVSLKLLGSDDDDDDDGDDDVFKWPTTPRSRPPSRFPSKSSLKHTGRQLPTPTRRRGHRPHDRSHDSLKKGGASAALESESEESGYGETYYTMHASSFDNDAFDSVIDTTMRGTPLGLVENNYSDNDSTVSYITGDFPQADPNDLRDATSQTLGHARTQTNPDMWNGSSRDISTQMPRVMQTQTDEMPRQISRSTQSLQSIGAQTRRSHGSRTDLLKSILSEVKTMKAQRGLDSPQISEDSQSVRSDTTLKKGMLRNLLTDVTMLKDHGAHGEAMTQTQEEQATQTGNRLFPEGDPVRNARHGRIHNLMEEIRDMKGGRISRNTNSPNADMRSNISQVGTPVERSRPMSSVSGANRNSPVRFGVPPRVYAQNGEIPYQNGYDEYAAGPGYMPPQQYMPTPPGIDYPGRRVTQNDINAISDRIQRLQSYQLPPRRTLPPPPAPPPPPPPPQFIVPVYSANPRRVHFRDAPESYGDDLDGFLSDESEYEGVSAPRRGRRRRRNPDLDRLGIEDALDQAFGASKQLKRMSKKMKNSLLDEFAEL